MNRNRIICIGAVNLDRIYHVSQAVSMNEAAICQSFSQSWGGKGLNQVAALRGAGEEPIFYAKVDKRDYESLCLFLQNKGISCEYISRIHSFTNHGVIQMTEDGNTAILGVANPEVSFSRQELENILEGLRAKDVLVLQNEIEDIPYIITKAKAAGCTVFLNPSPICGNMDNWPLGLTDYLIINEAEGRKITRREKQEEILWEFSRKYPDTAVVLTLGADGSIYQKGSRQVVQSGYHTQSIDTLGAGDTFLGYFISALHQGESISYALDIAAKAAAIVVSRRGAAEIIPVKEEVLRAGLTIDS